MFLRGPNFRMNRKDSFGGDDAWRLPDDALATLTVFEERAAFSAGCGWTNDYGCAQISGEFCAIRQPISEPHLIDDANPATGGLF